MICAKSMRRTVLYLSYEKIHILGLNLFVTSGLTGMSIKDVIVAAFPWTMTIFVGLMLVTYIPQIALWLPNLMYGG